MHPSEERIGVLVIGGDVDGESKRTRTARQRAGERLGKALGNAGQFRLVVCSAHDTAIDPFVLAGFQGTDGDVPGGVIVHHPKDSREVKAGGSIATQWRRLFRTVKVRKPYLRPHDEADVGDQDFSTAFLLCQLRALRDDADLIIVAGGKPRGSASVLLAAARDACPILPYPQYGGLGKSEFDVHKLALKQALGELLYDQLQLNNGVSKAHRLASALRRARGRYRVFLSYPWKRAAEADFVEAFLRRPRRATRPIEVFRDEVAIEEGESITQRIGDEIGNCDLLLMLWSSEYAASANCFDEFQAALRDDVPFHVMRLDETPPVWEELRRPGTHQWDAKWTPAWDEDRPEDPVARRQKLAQRLDDLVQKLARLSA